MLMVIFGAGASYDSAPSRPLGSDPPPFSRRRPPLAKDLFAERDYWRTLIRRFDKIIPVIPRLRHCGDAVESELETLREQATTNPARKQQLAAVQFYLQAAMWKCQSEWDENINGETNYKDLLDRIQHYQTPGEPTLLVTFNYDTMLEDALTTVGLPPRNFDDYIASDRFCLFKLHGSINWARVIDSKLDWPGTDAAGLARFMIENAAVLSISQRFEIVQPDNLRPHGAVCYPAIAIPVEKKLVFECPEAHLAALWRLLPSVTKVLIIGWRGVESHFKKKLKEHCNMDLPGIIVAGDPDSASATNRELDAAEVPWKLTPTGFGFTDFMRSADIENFLRR